MAELEHRRQRRLWTERPLEPGAERQDVAARDWERTGIRTEPAHVPAVNRQARALHQYDRQPCIGVCRDELTGRELEPVDLRLGHAPVPSESRYVPSPARQRPGARRPARAAARSKDDAGADARVPP